MARLTEAVDGLVASLQHAQAELAWIERQLEEEFGGRFGGRHKSGDINPLDVLTRIHQLRRELPAVADECAAVLQAKQECVDAAKRHLVVNAELLGELQRKAGQAEAAPGAEATRAAFDAAVREHEAKLQLTFDKHSNQITRAGLNEAFVHSVVA